MCRRGHQDEQTAGFTLVEIIVVVLILALAAGLAIPYAVGASSFQAVSGARIVASDLQYAQNTAITDQSSVTVTFQLSQETYTLSNASGPLIHPITKDAYTVNFGSTEGLSELDIVSASFAGNPSVTFDEMGAPDNPGSVTLQAGSHAYRVDVAAATGRVAVTALGS